MTKLIWLQSRPNIFDLEIRRPELLYKAVVEVDERVVLDKDGEGGWEEGEDGHEDAKKTPRAEVVQGLTGEGVRVVKEPDLDAVRESLQAVLDQGITSLAVVFLHRYLTCKASVDVGGTGGLQCSKIVQPVVLRYQVGGFLFLFLFLEQEIRSLDGLSF